MCCFLYCLSLVVVLSCALTSVVYCALFIVKQLVFYRLVLVCLTFSIYCVLLSCLLSCLVFYLVIFLVCCRVVFFSWASSSVLFFALVFALYLKPYFLEKKIENVRLCRYHYQRE